MSAGTAWTGAASEGQHPEVTGARPRRRQTTHTGGDVRLATLADVAELVRLRRLMFEAMGLDTRDDGWQHGAAEVIDRDLRAERLVAAVVDAPDGSGGLAASGIAQFGAHIPAPTNPTTTRAYVSSMSTDPRWQRRGYGTRVLDRLMDLCRSRGVGVVELHATDAGRILYERVGFVPRPGAPEMRWSDPVVAAGAEGLVARPDGRDGAASARQRRWAGPANTPSGS